MSTLIGCYLVPLRCTQPRATSLPAIAKPARAARLAWLGLAQVALAVVGSLLVAAQAQGGQFNVAPVRLDLASGQRAGTVEVTSAEPKPLLIRAEVQRWTVQEGKDVLTPSDDLAAVPPVFRLPAKGHQVLRVGYLGRPQTLAVEGTYRLVLTEVVEDEAPAGASTDGDASSVTSITVSTTLKLDMPVYVLPKKSRIGLGLSLSADDAAAADGVQRLRFDNHGNVHLKLSNLAIEDSRGQSKPLPLTYLLLMPGSQQSLRIAGLETLTPPLTLRYRQGYSDTQSPIAAP